MSLYTLILLTSLRFQDYNQAILLYNDARVEDALDYLEGEMEEKRNPANTEIEVIMFKIYDSKYINWTK